MIKLFFKSSILFLLFIAFAISCKKDETPSSIVQFADPNALLNESGSSKIINLTFSSALQADGTLLVGVEDSTAVYGTDYTTSPSGTSKTISIPVLKGATFASFTISPVLSMGDGDKTANFTITGLVQSTKFGSIIKLKATIVDDDLVCYLPMKGSAVDLSHYANSTQVQGAALTTGRKSISNTAYQLNGVSNDIVVSNSKVLDTIKLITLTAWIKPVSFGGVGNNAIIEKAYTSHVNPYYQYKLGITGDQHVLNTPGSFLFCLSVNGTYQTVFSNAGTWTPGNWYFVAGAYNGSTMKLYVNGSQVASMPLTGKIDHWGMDIYLGKVNNASEYTPGTLGDIRIYNRALSASEIGSLYLK